MHLLLIVVAGVLIAHLLIGMTRNAGCGCLLLILVLIMIIAAGSRL